MEAEALAGRLRRASTFLAAEGGVTFSGGEMCIRDRLPGVVLVIGVQYRAQVVLSLIHI